MRLIDEQYLRTPFYGSRNMAFWLTQQGYEVNRKRVQRLMRTMGLEAIYPRPSTTRRCLEHRIYPYLLRDVTILRPNQVWSTDITYIPLARGYGYLTAVLDWYSRYVLSWELSHTLDGEFCLTSTRTRARSSPARPSPAVWSERESRSAWTDEAELSTTCSWSGCGGV
jgi:putative transposase